MTRPDAITQVVADPDAGRSGVPRSEASPLVVAPEGGPSLPEDTSAATKRGLAFGLGAFGWWAVIVPLYFRELSRNQGASPWEILAQRVVFGVPVLLVLLLWRGELAAFFRAARTWRVMRVLIPSTLLIGVNWFFFIKSVADGNLSHASLGYYINPLVSVALGFIFLGERMRPGQWAAVGFAAVAVGVLTWAGGTLPYISIVLPLSFGMYGLLRKQASVGPAAGLTFEMLLLLPLCVGLMVWLETTDRAVFMEGPGWVTGLMLLGGVVTIVPLLCFTAAARLLPLSTLGLLQYLAPTGQLLLSFAFFGEAFGVEKWIAFGLIWVAIAVFTGDAILAVRAHPRVARESPQKIWTIPKTEKKSS